MCMTRSGRNAPSSPAVCTCSVKSQCGVMPASSTRRRNDISPHWPRTSGRAQGVHQVACLALQSGLALIDGLEVLAHRAEGFVPILLDVRNLRPRCVSSASWIGLSIVSMACSRSLRACSRLQLLLAEIFARELEEQLAVATQGFAAPASRRRSSVVPARARSRARVPARTPAVSAAASARNFEVDAQLLLIALRPQRRDQPAEEECPQSVRQRSTGRGKRRSRVHVRCAAPFSQPSSSAGSWIMSSACHSSG